MSSHNARKANLFRSQKGSSAPLTLVPSAGRTSVAKYSATPQGPPSQTRGTTSIAAPIPKLSNPSKPVNIPIIIEDSGDHREHSPLSASTQKRMKLIGTDDLDESDDQVPISLLHKEGVPIEEHGEASKRELNQGKRKVGDLSYTDKDFPPILDSQTSTMREKQKRYDETLDEMRAVWCPRVLP
ncbi:hypothetical protein Salat_0831300 [Sesamum alatum]|uniref:Uncharacterized protein n=1 Tax=Sesamum alatum TaxID=300844 RepID=A0AAE1YJ05_9LAMI|nr:hypothetical protein Salat_0831300 [Sesamum alatum]